jgi:predicted enzyme related to lactoylglutathione lyase
MEYWMISTTDYKGNKGLGQVMMTRQSPGQGIENYFDVKSVQEYFSKVEQSGGKVITQKTPVPGMGYFAICTDTEGLCCT